MTTIVSACQTPSEPRSDLPARAAVFFDRDGVLNLNKGYVAGVGDFEWVQGAVEAVKRTNELRMLAVVVTNQSGIARGYYHEADFTRLTQWMIGQLAAQGAFLDAIYYCPHHPSGKIDAYRKTCEGRKPGTGMILQALADFNVDLEETVLVGDSESDMLAAHAAKIRGLLFTGGNLLAFMESRGVWRR